MFFDLHADNCPDPSDQVTTRGGNEAASSVCKYHGHYSLKILKQAKVLIYIVARVPAPAL